MASSCYEPSESRSSRRYDTYPRPRDDSYLRPSAGTSEPRRRSGERREDGKNQGNARRPSPYGYSKDPTHDYADYPPPLPPDTGRPSRPKRSPSRRRPSWPPAPTCEDEAASLSKEAGSQQLLFNVGKDEARSRGKIDQEPILEDVLEYINQHERRFVLSEQPTPKTDLPTPPTSEDEKARKARRRPSKLDMGFQKVNDHVPEMTKRSASPYAYSRPSTQPKDETPTDRFLSADTLLSPPPTDPRSRILDQPRSRRQPASPRQERGKRSPSTRTGGDYFSLSGGESAVEDDDHRPNKAGTWPPSRDVPNATPRTSVVDFASQPASASMPVRRANLDARRNTDTSTTLPTMRSLRVEKQRRPTPLMASSALSELDDPRMTESPITLQPPAEFPLPRSRESSYVSSRAVSPAGSAVSATSATGSVAPQRSPRNSAEFFLDRSVESSPTVSRNGSVTDSRPSSPSPRTPAESPRLPRTDLDWSALMALNAARRPKPPSRLSAPIRQESAPISPRLDVRRSPRTDSLPYPIDEGPATLTARMPSERTHQYFPDVKTGTQYSTVSEPKSIPSAAPSATGLIPPAGTRPARPSFPSRHSTSDMPLAESRMQPESSKAAEPKRAAAAISSQAKKDLQALAKKPLPACMRAFPAAGYTDWYTLVGAPNLDFCPDCIDAMFERTVFRNYFRKSPPLNVNTKVQCALGGLPWIRLAWLLTLQQKRADLNLLKDIAEIEESHSEPCPGNRTAVRTWFGIRDGDGKFVKDFYICYSDVRKVERLLPTLNGLFVRHPYRPNDDKHLCAIRTDGNRFASYIDVLIHTHEKALESHKEADSSNFVKCVKRRQRLRECTKDNLLSNGLWHFIPTLPEFTVCEDCYETVIEPQVQKNNDLAMRFNRTIQPIYSEGIGISCQLYSIRMRSIFDRAARNKDFRYLARKATERRENEVRLQERYRHVMKKSHRLSWQSADSVISESDERKLDREIADISVEWKMQWE